MVTCSPPLPLCSAYTQTQRLRLAAWTAVPSGSVGTEEPNVELVQVTLSAGLLWPVVPCSGLEAQRPDPRVPLAVTVGWG